ncbi:hypothetical protein SAY87_002337 [Trapa incisa]|uniref:Cation efflux protein transmembrane domain-containing protein n=1 Tax=Trapa incisa TaxID=236973 RepID=A0AAN7PV39_9MYRT|nr:hypothetical protein SAY87_002337 [Trapa incisa]
MRTPVTFLLSRLRRAQKLLYVSTVIDSSSTHFGIGCCNLPHAFSPSNGLLESRSFSTFQNSSLTNPLKRPVLFGLHRSDAPDQQPQQHQFSSHRDFFTRAKPPQKIEISDKHSQRAVTTALWCNFLVFSLKFSVWLATSSHVMLAEVIHSAADFANQALLAYGLSSSRRAPDAIHPYGYSKERFVWSLISAVGIFCLGSGATVVHGFQNLWAAQVYLFLCFTF